MDEYYMLLYVCSGHSPSAFIQVDFMVEKFKLIYAFHILLIFNYETHDFLDLKFII